LVTHQALDSLAHAPADGGGLASGAPTHVEPAAGPEEDRAVESEKDPEPAAGADPEAEPARRLRLDRLSRSEIEVLQQLAARRAELDERARRLDRHAALLATAEADLVAQLERLEQLRAEVAAMVEAQDAAEEARLASLVKIYESMKPKAAAEIFNRLELPVLISVFERMRSARSAEVLARMEPAKARQVTAELARRAERLHAAGPAGSAP